jgi:hypothetical protein
LQQTFTVRLYYNTVSYLSLFQRSTVKIVVVHAVFGTKTVLAINGVVLISNHTDTLRQRPQVISRQRVKKPGLPLRPGRT